MRQLPLLRLRQWRPAPAAAPSCASTRCPAGHLRKADSARAHVQHNKWPLSRQVCMHVMGQGSINERAFAFFGQLGDIWAAALCSQSASRMQAARQAEHSSTGRNAAHLRKRDGACISLCALSPTRTRCPGCTWQCQHLQPLELPDPELAPHAGPQNTYTAF